MDNKKLIKLRDEFLTILNNLSEAEKEHTYYYNRIINYKRDRDLKLREIEEELGIR